jgi:hypothetical protein
MAFQAADGAKQHTLSRSDNADRSLARSAWESAPRKPSRRVRYDRAHLIPEVFLVAMDRFPNLRDTITKKTSWRLWGRPWASFHAPRGRGRYRFYRLPGYELAVIGFTLYPSGGP